MAIFRYLRHNENFANTFTFFGRTGFGQNIQSVQLFNPQTNDETLSLKLVNNWF